MSNRRETALEEQNHTVHHTMAVDPMPGERITGWPAGLTFRPIGPSQVGGCFNRRCKKQYWAFDQNSANPRPAGLREAGWPDISTPCAQLRVEVTLVDLLA